MYNFGIYHWRRRFARLAVGLLAVVAGAVGLRRADGTGRALGLTLMVAGLLTAERPARRLAASPPWSVSVGKYEALTDAVSMEGADVLVDVGCGTGRSLVGMAPAVPSDATLVGLDVFDDRIILGNGPALARRNAARAGVTVTPVRGDATTLPFADGSVDVVTLSRVLHDLSAEGARETLAETRRALGADGRLGVLELPLPHDDDAEPEPYWTGLVADAGFDVTESRVLDGEYVVVAAVPKRREPVSSRHKR